MNNFVFLLLVRLAGLSCSWGTSILPGAGEGCQAVPSLVSVDIMSVTHSVSETVGDGGMLGSSRFVLIFIFVLPASIGSGAASFIILLLFCSDGGDLCGLILRSESG